jgi:hypothetical protein
MLHGFKVGWYVDLANATRRLMWTLAHAHGTLLALVHIAFAASLGRLAEEARLQRFASPCLIGASILLPGGFFLGGLVVHAGDPGLGILLVPAGGLLLFGAVLATALAASRGAARPAAPIYPQETESPAPSPPKAKGKRR